MITGVGAARSHTYTHKPCALVVNESLNAGDQRPPSLQEENRTIYPKSCSGFQGENGGWSRLITTPTDCLFPLSFLPAHIAYRVMCGRHNFSSFDRLDCYVMGNE